MDYNYLLNTESSDKWKKIGIKRRSGITVPLFSVYSKQSEGIGDILDIKHLVKLCVKTGNSIIQLLPLNDVGSDFSPYNAISSFAIDPMYLSVSKLKDVNLTAFKKEIRKLKKDFPTGLERVNYKIKEAKLELLWNIFRTVFTSNKKYENFINNNSYWLKDYALYKVIKSEFSDAVWEEFPDSFKNRETAELDNFEKENEKKIKFIYWVQWQLFEQMKLVKKYASENNVLLMGDIPFLTARDSGDVWAHKEYFDLNLSSGAPPDMYFAQGQRWGTPPYICDALERDNYKYLKAKYKYAENFYDTFRIDHFVGFFRVWVVENNIPSIKSGKEGSFIPPDESIWESGGKKLIDVILNSSGMLPVAEDLGTVPACSGKVLWEYGIPGTNVQRWMKEHDNNFTDTGKYRINSVSTLSTHDSSLFVNWWLDEAETVDAKVFDDMCRNKNLSDDKIGELKEKLFDANSNSNKRLRWKEEIDTVEKMLSAFGFGYEFNEDLIKIYLETYGERKKFLNNIGYELNSLDKINNEFIECVLEKISSSSSIFNILLLHDWLTLDESFHTKLINKDYRINYPGIANETNWTSVIPYPLEILLNMRVNEKIKSIIIKTEREVL